MYEMIAAPFFGSNLLLRPRCRFGAQLPPARYDELAAAPPDLPCPPWPAAAATAFGVDVDGRSLGDAGLVRAESPYGYGRASYELNLGCNRGETCHMSERLERALKMPMSQTTNRRTGESRWRYADEPAAVERRLAERVAELTDLMRELDLSNSDSGTSLAVRNDTPCRPRPPAVRSTTSCTPSRSWMWR